MKEVKKYTLETWAPMACFTRPEMKVERVSYEVITPSAARAVFEAVFWKPQLRWQVVRIEVLCPIAFMHLRRNEVASMTSIKKPYILASNYRQQRSSLVLRNVRYRITAEMEVHTERLRTDETHEKYHAMFLRRASRGQCFVQPYLGCREFSADWRLVGVEEPCTPIKESKDLGIMLYDIDFTNVLSPTPIFYRAVMNDGIIHVPRL